MVKTIIQMRINRLVLFLSCIILATACSKAPYFEETKAFKDNEWKQNEKPKFVVNIDDTSAVYSFTLTLRTTTSYQYSNLWFFWNTKTPTGETVREPFELKIANPDGTWIGKNSGTVVENQLHFSSRKIGLKGKYVFTLEQGITEPVIGEVMDVGLKVEKLQSH